MTESSELPTLAGAARYGDMLRNVVSTSGIRRRAIGIEINPEYCDLIWRRLAQSVLPLEG